MHTSALKFNDDTKFTSVGIGGGGALLSPSINPNNDNEFYIGCDMSQVYHSIDFGSSYHVIPHFNLQWDFNQAYPTYEFTNDTSIAYTLNQEYQPLQTVDGGKSWNLLLGYNPSYGKVYRISADSKVANRVIISLWDRILYSDDFGSTFPVDLSVADPNIGLLMAGVFWNDNIVYIGTNKGVYCLDYASPSFKKLNEQGLGAHEAILSFAGAKSGTQIRFVCITSSDTIFNGIRHDVDGVVTKGIYIMNNADCTWSQNNDNIDFNTDVLNCIGMSPQDINTVFLGGISNTTSASLILKSENGCKNWETAFKTAGNENIITGWLGHGGDKSWGWSGPCMGIAVSLDTQKVVFSNYMGVFTSNNKGQSWKQGYVDSRDQHPAGQDTPKKQTYKSIGLEDTSCWHLMWIDSSTIYGGFSDIGGIKSNDRGDKWGYTYSGSLENVNSLYRIAKDNKGILYGACSSIHDMYQITRLSDNTINKSDADGKIVYSSDSGRTWNNMHLFNHPVYWITLDPNNSDRMYAAIVHFDGVQGSQEGGIWVTDNLSAGPGANWHKLDNPPRTEGHPASIEVLSDAKVVCTFSGRISNQVFTPSSGVFLYDPSTNSWTDNSAIDMHYWTKDIVRDPTDPNQNTWYVAVFSGWGGPPNDKGGLYKTTDRGASWKKLTAGQFQGVTSLAFNPSDSKQAFLTTTIGLYMSNDMNQEIPTWSFIPGYPFRQPERVFFNPFDPTEVWVTSFGNGLMRVRLGI